MRITKIGTTVTLGSALLDKPLSMALEAELAESDPIDEALAILEDEGIRALLPRMLAWYEGLDLEGFTVMNQRYIRDEITRIKEELASNA